MSCWNYRVLAHDFKGEVCFQIHEVHYNDEGVPISYTERAVPAMGDENLDTLKEDLEYMLKALDEPVLVYGDNFPEEYQQD